MNEHTQQHEDLNHGIPIATSLPDNILSYNHKESYNKNRLITISMLAVAIAACISIIAKLLVFLINLITNISFFQKFSIHDASPATNALGWWVIVIPVIGGLIIGLMAVYGSKAIRGHGIPEAMEQVLTNQSRIKPAIMYLKPLSSAISIGTGGPFGAEGPIIATGGAIGSTLGQIMKITHYERKILLAAGATAGMSAIFGTPIAAIFLAIELLLFEFSPRSFIPVAVACITGAAGHHFLFDPGYAFGQNFIIASPSNPALLAYSLMGIVIGFLSVAVTKIVYFIEDAFEKLPVHWAWWPAIGGLAVGIIGYYFPRTLGVGYSNISEILSGSVPLKILLSLCIMKFLSWSIALSSGTSGGTLAPLLTIGGAAGALLGMLINMWFPNIGVTLPLAALVGMSAMFAGASRALITSIIFALEGTGQANALLPLLGTCTASYFVSFFIMENTIMTEKIARRGVKTPFAYQPDNLEKINVGDTVKQNNILFSEENSISEVRNFLSNRQQDNANYFIITSDDGSYKGILSASTLNSNHHKLETKIGSLVKRKNIFITNEENLRSAAELMAKENIDVLPVLNAGSNHVVGILSYKDIIDTFKYDLEEHIKKQPSISLRRQGLKVLVRGQQLVSVFRTNPFK